MIYFQIRVPLDLSTHHRYRLLSASATFRKIWLPQMIGVAPVLLGMGSFQSTFSVGLHRTGRFFSPLIPFNLGPRHCGQSSAKADSESANNDNDAGKWRSCKSVLLLPARRRGIQQHIIPTGVPRVAVRAMPPL